MLTNPDNQENSGSQECVDDLPEASLTAEQIAQVRGGLMSTGECDTWAKAPSAGGNVALDPKSGPRGYNP